LRAGRIKARPRREASLAVSADGASWFLLGATADLRSQIESCPPLHPKEAGAPRQSPVAGILLSNGDLDQCLGLLALREDQPLHVYATARVRQGFTGSNVLYRTLDRFAGQVTWHRLLPHEPSPLAAPSEAPGDGEARTREAALEVTALPLPGKVPLHLQARLQPDPEDNVALLIRDRTSGRSLAYLPSVAEDGPVLRRLLDQADCVFFDGTFWSEDELLALGIGRRRASDMAHWPLAGPGGSLAVLARSRAALRILIHINNTNPILREDSPERQQVEAAGVQVAYDGLELRL
jgi:pyrroloquinoline quinone biosynthesis protein B